MTPQVGIAGAGGERHRPMCPAAGNRAALLGERGDRAGHCDVGSQREGERGGQHARLRVISARRPAGASGSLPQKPEGLADDRQGARGTGVTGGLQEGTGDRAGVAGGLRGTSVHTARASSSSEAEAACFALCLDGSKARWVGPRGPTFPLALAQGPALETPGKCLLTCRE